ncbi:tryptophan-rich sensory protein [Nocardioides solisilvae]|uniref:tryptophan-rich sensory protein n=1 Tax=Nocardioides solisilvae TaxID=1542435 RepID=UPI000D750CE1|nr:tryptophan-rich sensory protein [Nocardioides solisilvae]
MSLPRTESPTSTDRARQVTVTVSEVLCLVGTLVGTGVIGTPVSESAGGALSDQATLLAPAGPAFSIWSVIYAGLLAYTVWQWLPGRATDPRLRATGWLAAASMLLNASWLLVTQAGSVWGGVVVIVALAAVLGVLAHRLVTVRSDAEGSARTVDRVVVEGTFGLYLGWVSVATCANVAAALADSGVTPSSPTADVLAAVVLAVVAALAAFYAWRIGARTVLIAATAAAMAWGLAWIAVGRSTEAPESTLATVAAVVAAVVVAGAALLRVRGNAGVSHA